MRIQRRARGVSKTRAGVPVKSERGSLHAPLALIVALVAVFGLGLIGLQKSWKKLARSQIELDECVGSVALEFRDLMRSIEGSNLRIEATRLALIPATLLPPARAALQVALNAQVLEQETRRLGWEATRANWLVGRRCKARGEIPYPLPGFPWTRDPPDPLGARPLRWSGEPTKVFFFIAIKPPRAAAAGVFHALGIWSALWGKRIRTGSL